ncbi:MAG: OmpA family protein [Calditrichia bacterium]
MKKILIAVMATSLLMLSVGCNMSNTKKGAGIGGTAGAVIGGLIGKAAGNTAVGAIVGAAVGGSAGAYIGNYMDKQSEEMQRDIEGAKIERVGEGIKITFDSGLLFDVNSSNLKQASKDNLTNMATILQKYPDTNIVLEGHTDDTGREEYNLELSKKRAESVYGYLSALEVDASRFTVNGFGEAQPVADNSTDAGRATNRRVEVAIFANEDLKKAAEKATNN